MNIRDQKNGEFVAKVKFSFGRTEDLYFPTKDIRENYLSSMEYDIDSVILSTRKGRNHNSEISNNNFYQRHLFGKVSDLEMDLYL